MRYPAALAAAVLAVAVVPAFAQPPAASVVFQIDHVRDDTGHVRVDICTEATFLKEACPYSGAAPAVKGVTTVTVTGVPPGVYAAQVYHDRNDDHTVNRGRFGIPLEEVGFSNNAFIGLRGPKWAKAAFSHDSTDQQLAVKLHRYE
jgi:uncharacterized protein (DUF2141 family)